MNFVILRIATIVLALEAAILFVPLLLFLQVYLAVRPIGGVSAATVEGSLTWREIS